MFDNIGGKIKGLAAVCCWIMMGMFVLVGLLSMGQNGFFGGLILIVSGLLISWVSSFVLYGFGELVECASDIRAKLYQRPVAAPQQQPSNITPVRAAAPAYERPKHTPSGGWRCKNCGYSNSSTAMYCTDCGQSR